jgi:hypothetical protein
MSHRWDVFALGVAVGLTVMMMAAARRVSPFKASVICCGVFVAARYVALAAIRQAGLSVEWGELRLLWHSGMTVLSWLTIVAADQLVRHPAMTPKRLVGWVLLPFLAACGVTAPWWTAALTVQELFTISFIGVCVLLIRKLPFPPIRRALAGLVVGQGCLGTSGWMSAFGGWGFLPYFIAELVMLLALWSAYETAWTQGR